MMPDRLHRVRPGDVLSRIAVAHLANGSKPVYEALARYNAIPDPDLIFPGQLLWIPRTVATLYQRVGNGRIHLPSPAPDLTEAPERAPAPAPERAPVTIYLPADGAITSGYGPREAIPSIGVEAHFHPGVDIWWPGCAGEPFLSPISGAVVHAGDQGNGYGLYVIVDGRPGAVILAAHFASTHLRSGDVVRSGDPLGLVGSSGASTGAHVHLELQLDNEENGWTYGASVDPLRYASIQRL